MFASTGAENEHNDDDVKASVVFDDVNTRASLVLRRAESFSLTCSAPETPQKPTRSVQEAATNTNTPAQTAPSMRQCLVHEELPRASEAGMQTVEHIRDCGNEAREQQQEREEDTRVLMHGQRGREAAERDGHVEDEDAEAGQKPTPSSDNNDAHVHDVLEVFCLERLLIAVDASALRLCGKAYRAWRSSRTKSVRARALLAAFAETCALRRLARACVTTWHTEASAMASTRRALGEEHVDNVGQPSRRSRPTTTTSRPTGEASSAGIRNTNIQRTERRSQVDVSSIRTPASVPRRHGATSTRVGGDERSAHASATACNDDDQSADVRFVSLRQCIASSEASRQDDTASQVPRSDQANRDQSGTWLQWLIRSHQLLQTLQMIVRDNGCKFARIVSFGF